MVEQGAETEEPKLDERDLSATEQAFVGKMVSFYRGIAGKVGLAEEDVVTLEEFTSKFVGSEIRNGEIVVKEPTKNVARPEQ